MSKFISYAIRLFFMSLFIILYSQGLAVSQSECTDPSSTIPGYYERCNPDWKPHWSPTNSQEITPGGSAVVTFEGGQLPYTWQISGAGYWLDDQYTLTSIVTDTISATIYADSSACGAVTVSVTDFCDDQTVGGVRGTNGTWGDPIAGCILPGEGNWWTPGFGYEIRGKYKQTQHITNLSGSNFDWAQCPTEKCDNACASSAACDPDFGCEPCLYIDQNEIPCTNAGYAGADCPPACRAWCTCNTVLYYQQWVCP